MITEKDILNRRIETVTSPYDGHQYEVEYGLIPYTIGRETRLLPFQRTVYRTHPGHWYTLGKPILVRVGRGTKTYAVDAQVGRRSVKGPDGKWVDGEELVQYNLNALNRVAYAVGFVDEKTDETNIRSGYGG